MKVYPVDGFKDEIDSAALTGKMRNG